MNIGKNNVGGNRIDIVGGNATVDSTDNPSSTNIGSGNVGGDRIGEVKGDLRITKLPDKAKDVKNLGNGNVGGDYIGKVGRDLTIEGSTEIAQQIKIETVVIPQVDSPQEKRDLDTLGKAFNCFCNQVQKYTPGAQQKHILEANFQNAMDSFMGTFQEISFNISTLIKNDIENYVSHARHLKEIVDHLDTIAPHALYPITPEDQKFSEYFNYASQQFLDYIDALKSEGEKIQSDIKKARGIDK